ncbi:MAG: hypothetical protein RQ875_02975 [Vicingaceae bacterium]|nr:hypothetical protein [Vicingaceae bacterium]
MLPFTKIPILFAGIIILLHSFIPHSHNEQKSESLFTYSEKFDSSIFYEFILKLASNDIGEGHLEDFIIEEANFSKCNLSEHSDHVLFFDYNLTQLKNLHPLFISNYLNLFNPNFKTNTSLFCLSFRGPPYFQSI